MIKPILATFEKVFRGKCHEHAMNLHCLELCLVKSAMNLPWKIAKAAASYSCHIQIMFVALSWHFYGAFMEGLKSFCNYLEFVYGHLEAENSVSTAHLWRHFLQRYGIAYLLTFGSRAKRAKYNSKRNSFTLATIEPWLQRIDVQRQ